MLNTFFRSVTIFQLFAVLAIAIWWIVPLWMIGVFDDGMFYSSISRNLVYDAQATIWDLKVSNALDHSFNGHPPMLFWIESVFFWVLGDYYWIERVFSFIAALITIFLIHKCWSIFNKESSAPAVLFWLCIPIVGWCYGNNMLENVLVIFSTAAIWLILKNALLDKHFALTVLVASLLIFGATLTKGPIGLYPLATWGIFALVYDRKQLLKATLGTILITALLITDYLLLFYYNTRALQFFERYISLQLEGSLAGMDSLAAHRFFLLQVILEELLLVIPFIIICKLSAVVLKLEIAQKVNWRLVTLWLIIALSASLPMLISPKQLRFYIVPSMVFFCLSLATMTLPLFHAWATYLKSYEFVQKLTKILISLAIVFCLVLSFCNVQKYARSFDVLPDSFKMGEVIPKHTEAYLHPSIYNTWNLHAYMYRYFYIDLSTVFKNQPYVIFPKDIPFNSAKYREKKADLEYYRLYERI